MGRNLKLLDLTFLLGAVAASVLAGCSGLDSALDGAADSGIADEGDDPGGEAYDPPNKPDPAPPDTDDTCDTDNGVELEVPIGDTNATAGPALARFMIERARPVTHEIRAQEFLNYYSPAYEPATAGTVAVVAELAGHTDGAVYDLQVGVRVTAQVAVGRPGYNLTLMVDAAESMSGTPIQRVKQGCVALANSLADGDLISLVSSATDQHVLLATHAVEGPGDPTVIERCNSIAAGAAADIHQGIASAYELAEAGHAAERINRVVMLSDGSAGVDVEDVELIAARANDGAGAIRLMVAGVGNESSPDAYDDRLLSALSDAGRGAYVFIDTAGEAAAVFGEQLLGHLGIAGREAQVELVLPPTFALAAPLAAEYDSSVPAFAPQDMGVNRPLVLQRQLVSCDPAVVEPEQSVLVEATVEDPLTGELWSAAHEATLGELLEAANDRLAKGRAVVAYATALEQLQSKSGASAVALIDETLAAIEPDALALDGDPDLAEITTLLQTYRQQFE